VVTFEYLQVHVHGRQWFDSAGREGELEERRHSRRNLSMVDLGPLLNELGSQVWELAGVRQIGMGYEYCLKRRR
jgi:hypothetical protein